jgi:hypothetical protein
MKVSPQPNNLDVLFLLRGANLQSLLTDQGLAASSLFHSGGVTQPFNKFIVTDIRLVRVTGDSTGCTAGIFTGTGGGGTVIVAAGTSMAGMTAADTQVKPALAAAANTNILTLPSAAVGLNFRVDVISVAACTADIYVFGFPLY